MDMCTRWVKTDSNSSGFSKLTRTMPALVRETVSLIQQCAQGTTLHLSRARYIQHSSVPVLSFRTDLIHTDVLLHFPILQRRLFVCLFVSFPFVTMQKPHQRQIKKLWEKLKYEKYSPSGLCLFNDTKMVYLPSFFLSLPFK